jgi:methyl-accepting chemotaxis protein
MQLTNIVSAFESQMKELKNKSEDAEYVVSDKLSLVQAEMSEMARLSLDSSQENKDFSQALSQVKERANYLMEVLMPLVSYFKVNNVKLSEDQKKILNENLSQQLEYLKKNIKIIEFLIDKEKGGNLNSLDWPIWILSSIAFLLFIFMIRSRSVIRTLREENSRYRNQIESKGMDFVETKDNLNRIKINIDQSTNEVETLNQQISSILDKNNNDNSNQFEEQYQNLLELLQTQKNFIYRAITGASTEETNKLVISGLINFVEEVSAKSKVIHDIAFKTKVLSFNASVEAERAGARGRGFSIVAQEMKRLAEISGKASEEIASLVERTRRGTQILNNQGESDSSVQNSIQNTLVEASGNLETIQSKINELNTFLNVLVNQKGVTHSNLEYAYKVVNQIAKAQNEIKVLNDSILYTHDALAS